MVDNRRGQRLEIRVNPEDLGRVIGRNGRTAKALRQVDERCRRQGHPRRRRRRRPPLNARRHRQARTGGDRRADRRRADRPGARRTRRRVRRALDRRPRRAVRRRRRAAHRPGPAGPLTVESGQPAGAQAWSLHFVGVDDREAAEALRGVAPGRRRPPSGRRSRTRTSSTPPTSSGWRPATVDGTDLGPGRRRRATSPAPTTWCCDVDGRRAPGAVRRRDRARRRPRRRRRSSIDPPEGLFDL